MDTRAKAHSCEVTDKRVFRKKVGIKMDNCGRGWMDSKIYLNQDKPVNCYYHKRRLCYLLQLSPLLPPGRAGHFNLYTPQIVGFLGKWKINDQITANPLLGYGNSNRIKNKSKNRCHRG